MRIISLLLRDDTKLFHFQLGDPALPETEVEKDNDYMIEQIGKQRLLDHYLSHVMYRAKEIDKVKAGTSEKPAEYTLDWTGENMPLIGKHGPRSGEPTKADIAFGEKVYALPDEKLESLLEAWSAKAPHSLTLESLQEEEEPEKALAAIWREVRLAIARQADKEQKALRGL